MDSFREEKVKKFEEFVDLRLKPDLVHAIAQRYSEVLFFKNFLSSDFPYSFARNVWKNNELLVWIYVYRNTTLL